MTVSDLVPSKLNRDWSGVRSLALAGFALIMLIAVAVVPHLRGEIFSAIESLLSQAQQHHLGLPVAIAVFVATAYLGAPQAVLIAACVLAFGAADGFVYSWIATIISGATTFSLGKNQVRAGSPLANTLRKLSNNGFSASLLMRFVPGPPFILVNMALAASGVRFWPYLLGLAVGVIPKTAIIAFAGGGILHALNGQLGVASALIVGVVVFVVAAAMMRRYIRVKLEPNAP